MAILSKERIMRGEIMVAHVPAVEDDWEQAEHTTAELHRLADTLDIPLVILAPGFTIEMLTKDQLERLGWCRCSAD